VPAKENHLKLIPVNDPSSRQEFLALPLTLYKNHDYWIRPLDKDIENVFDPKTNKTFRKGEATRWIVQNDQGQTVGRVAAFINEKSKNKGNDQPTGGIGFFESINDQKVAFMLFDACKDWLSERGIEAMDGPINFGDRDKWWGLLVDGYDLEPNYQQHYNYPYYRDLFEAYGFKTYFKQLTYGRKTRDPLSPKLATKAENLNKDKAYSFEHMRLSNLAKYTDDFRVIYNQAWGGHGVPDMSSAQAKAIIAQLKPIIDEKIVWFGYYNNDPIAFFIMLPEVNQIFKYVNGKLDWIGKLKFVWHKWRKTCNKMFGLVFGIVPAHQGKGVEGALIMAARQMVQDDYHRYENFEMNWIGDFNPKMIRVAEQVGGYIAKTHITYRKLFDETKEFKRHPFI
jgi:GNAT superfamily N-acetyltransferase